MNLSDQEPQPEPEYRTIPLSQGKFAIVDVSDYDWLNQWKWYAVRPRGCKKFYATRNLRSLDGPQRSQRMHRLILGVDGQQKVDHINRDSLDNRRANLRAATDEQNSHNTGTRCTNTSGYRGVTWHPFSSLWHARIYIKGTPVSLGYFKDPADASAAYEAKAKEHRGEFYHPPTGALPSLTVQPIILPSAHAELPACAAVRHKDGTIIAGKRYGDCLLSAFNCGLHNIDLVHGFVTTRGRFVNCEEAILLMKDSNARSIDPGGFRGDHLRSEDLY